MHTIPGIVKFHPGIMCFNLRVLDAMGRVSPFTKTLEIEIARAFWQTTLFKTCWCLIYFIGWVVTFKMVFQVQDQETKT